MKKRIIIFAVFAIALGIVLITVGILGCAGLSGALKSDENSDDLGFAYLLLYGLLIFLQILYFGFIVLGIPYLITGSIALFAFFREDLFRVRRHLRIAKVLNTIWLVLLILGDLSTIGTFFKGWQDKTTIVFNIFAILITILTIAVEVTCIIAHKKVKNEIKTKWHSD